MDFPRDAGTRLRRLAWEGRGGHRDGSRVDAKFRYTDDDSGGGRVPRRRDNSAAAAAAAKSASFIGQIEPAIRRGLEGVGRK